MRTAIAVYRANVSAAGQVVEIQASSSQPLNVVSIHVEQSTDSSGEQLEWSVKRVTTKGSGGTTITPQLLDPSDAAAGWLLMHSWTTAPVEGDTIFQGAFPTVGGAYWDTRPDTELVVPANGAVVVRLEKAPSAAIDLIVRVVARE